MLDAGSQGMLDLDFRPESRQAASERVCVAHARRVNLSGQQKSRMECGSQFGQRRSTVLATSVIRSKNSPLSLFGDDHDAFLIPFLRTDVRSSHNRRGQAERSWYVDETYIKVHGKWCYLY